MFFISGTRLQRRFPPGTARPPDVFVLRDRSRLFDLGHPVAACCAEAGARRTCLERVLCERLITNSNYSAGCAGAVSSPSEALLPRATLKLSLTNRMGLLSQARRFDRGSTAVRAGPICRGAGPPEDKLALSTSEHPQDRKVQSSKTRPCHGLRFSGMLRSSITSPSFQFVHLFGNLHLYKRSHRGGSAADIPSIQSLAALPCFTSTARLTDTQ